VKRCSQKKKRNPDVTKLITTLSETDSKNTNTKNPLTKKSNGVANRFHNTSERKSHSANLAIDKKTIIKLAGSANHKKPDVKLTNKKHAKVTMPTKAGVNLCNNIMI